MKWCSFFIFFHMLTPSLLKIEFQGVCLSNPCGENSICVTLKQRKHHSYYCHCVEGYILSDSGRYCFNVSKKIETRKNRISGRNRFETMTTISSGGEAPSIELEMDVDVDEELKNETKQDSGHDKQEKSVFYSPAPLVQPMLHRFTRQAGEESAALVEQECQRLQCLEDGICLSQLNSVTRCFCRLGYSGKRCEQTISYKFPKFSGRSFLKFGLPSSIEKLLRVSIHVHPKMATGLVLYTASRNNTSPHFFSLSLQQGQFEFRYFNGYRILTIRSPIIVNVHQWHQVEIFWNDQTSWLNVNRTRTYLPLRNRVTRNIGHHRTSRMNLSKIMFLGHVLHPMNLGGSMASDAVERSGVDVGLVGCAMNLMVDGHELDMRRKPFIGDAIDGLDIHDCAEGCKSHKCINNGRCKTTIPPYEYVCKCALGTSGKRCELHDPPNRLITIPRFAGFSYMRLRGLRKTSQSNTRLELVFRPETPNGLILYNGLTIDRRGDFLAVLLNNGTVEVVYDLGTGPARLRSRQPLQLNRWHSIILIRHGRFGKLSVNSDDPVNAYSAGKLVQLTINLDLFLGGHRNLDEVSHEIKPQSNFKGCIQKLIINQQDINFLNDIKKGVNIESCESHECISQKNICLNKGKCVPNKDAFFCQCPLGFHGIHCEKVKAKDEFKAVQFSEQSYLIYNNNSSIPSINFNNFSLTLSIKLHHQQDFQSREASILLMSGSFHEERAYLLLSTIGNQITLRLSDGSYVHRQSAYVHVNLWNRVTLNRRNSECTLSLNGSTVIRFTMDFKVQIERIIFGILEPSQLSVRVEHDKNDWNELTSLHNFVNVGFTGCLKDIKVSSSLPYDVNNPSKNYVVQKNLTITVADHGRNIEPCK